jgi:hypothetical protein
VEHTKEIHHNDNHFWVGAKQGILKLKNALSSEMQLHFVTDAGLTEQIPVISSGLETSGIILEYLSADPSGRSFVLKSPGHKLPFFWQSESCKAVGDEMVCKVIFFYCCKNSLREQNNSKFLKKSLSERFGS